MRISESPLQKSTMSKKDAALSALVSMGIALTGSIVASQLELKLTESGQSSSNKTQQPQGKPDSPPRIYETVGGPKQWDQIHDVIVVGSGAAGLMAGISALWTKPELSVLVVEGDSKVGGTTAKSGGVFWLPNNVKMTVPDSREDTIKLLARLGFPEKYDTGKPMLGLDENEYSRLCQFYDLGRPLSQQLQQVAYHLTRVRDSQGRFLFDYTYSQRSQPENVAPQQRHLGVGVPSWQRTVIRSVTSGVSMTLPLLRKLQQILPVTRELSTFATFGLDFTWGFGGHLVQVLETELIKSGKGKVQTDSVVDGLVTDDGTVVGVRVFNAKKNQHEWIGARRGVIFASGGYSHDQSLIKELLLDHGRFVQRTGAGKRNDGVFVHVARKLGAEMSDDDMRRIWGCEAIYDESAPWESPTCLFQMRGDSFFVVGPDGKRMYNEKGKYDLRARVHWQLSKDSCADPSKGVFFMIGDARCQNIFGGETLANSWPRDPEDPRYVKGRSIDEVAANIAQRFPQFVHSTFFKANLGKTLDRFNEFARKGVDSDFKRGTECPSEEQWTSTGIPGETNAVPNRAMFPLEPSGPFFALPIVASIIDTKGGPKLDSQARVLQSDGMPLDRLFAAGNCASNLTGDAYLSGGLTLGSALVSGYVAGMNAVLRGPGGAKL